jgi:hypothetical protein
VIKVTATAVNPPAATWANRLRTHPPFLAM